VARRRLQFIKPGKHQKMIWQTPGGMGLFIIMCAMMVMLIFWLPSLMKAFTGASRRVPPSTEASPTEEMQAQEEATPRTPPRPHVALPPEEERKLLATVKDQDPLEKKPYFYLLAKVNAMTDAQIGAAVDPTITYDTFATPGGPQKARGKVVRPQGLLLRLKKVKITDVTSGFDWVWEGYLMDNDLRPTAFILTQPTAPRKFVPKDDMVVVKGIYFKNVVYKDQESNWQGVPLIIAKDLVKIVPPRATQTLWLRYREYVIFALIAVAVIGIMLLEYRRRIGAAVAARPRRGSNEPMEVVPDEEAGKEGEEQEEPTQESQHVNPGPGKETTSEKKADEEKKPEA